MRILHDVQASDEETLIFGVTVINKTLHGVPDQVGRSLIPDHHQMDRSVKDTFFDVVDCLEGQGMEEAVRQMGRMNNAQLSQQCALYEQELRKEDAALDSDASSAGGGGAAQNGHVAKMRWAGERWGGEEVVRDTLPVRRGRGGEKSNLKGDGLGPKKFHFRGFRQS